MKRTIFTVLMVFVLSSSVMASGVIDKTLEKNDVIFRLGYEVTGDDDDSKNIKYSTSGNPCSTDGSCGKYGLDRDAAYEFSIGLEEKVDDFKFGTRKMLTIYNDGDAVFHNGHFTSDVTNAGIEATYAVFYKATKYFKPYLGAGLGVNRQTNDDESEWRENENYSPTFVTKAGISGELFAGFGYYVEYKYRFADNKKISVFTRHNDDGSIIVPGSGLSDFNTVDIEIEGVDGGRFMAGISYQF